MNNKKIRQIEYNDKINTEPVDRGFNIQRYRVEGTKITMTGGDGKLVYLLYMLPIIDASRVFCFTIRITHTKQKQISIGIRDQEKKYTLANDSPFHSRYYGTGWKYPEGVQVGTTYGEGDIVETVVDIKGNKIQWKVNGTVKATSTAPQGTKFIPQIGIYDNGDSIEWMGCKYLEH